MATKYLILFFSALALASAQQSLRCYDCDPTKGAGKCVTNVTHDATSVICTRQSTKSSQSQGQILTFFKEVEDIERTEIESKGLPGQIVFECFTIQFKSSHEPSNPSGVYRGCAEKSKQVVSACDMLKENLKGGNVSSCNTCPQDNCNKANAPGGAAAQASLSLGFLLISALFAYLTAF